MDVATDRVHGRVQSEESEKRWRGKRLAAEGGCFPRNSVHVWPGLAEESRGKAEAAAYRGLRLANWETQ